MRVEAIAYQIEELLILGLTALVPFFFVPAEWFTVPQAKMFLLSLVVLMVVLAYAVGAYFRDELAVPRNLLFYALASVPLAYLISALFTGWSAASLVGGMGQDDTVFAMLTSLAVLFIAVHVYSRSSQMVVIGLRAFATGTLVLLLLELLHVLFPAITFGGAAQGITFNFVGTPHDFAIFSALSLLLFLMYVRTPVFGSLIWRSVALVGATGSLIVLLLLELPDIWLGCSVFAALFAVYLWRLTLAEDRPGTQPYVVTWGIFALVCLTLAFFAPSIGAQLPSSLHIAQIETRPSWQSTFAIARSTLGNPQTILFGTGPSTFAHDWNLYKPVSVNSTAFWNSQFDSGTGFVPTSFVTMGLLGLLSWGFVLVALGWALVRTFMLPPGRAALARAPLVLLATFLFAFHLLYAPSAALAILLWLTCALSIALSVHGGEASAVRLREASWRGISASIALMVGVAIMFFVSTDSLRAVFSDAYVNRAMSALAQGDTKSAGDYVATAIVLSSTNDRAQREAVALGLNELSALFASGATSSEAAAQLQSALDTTISHGLTAVSIDGGDNQNWLALASVYAQLAGAHVSGADSSAREAYARAAAASPADPSPHMQLAQLDLLAGDTADARTELQKVLALKPDIALAYYLLSQVDASAGDLATARSEALQAANLSPQDPTVMYNLGAILYAQNDYTDAVTVLERTVSLQNNYANALLLLGLSYDKVGDKANALTSLQSVATLDPNDGSVQTMLKNIQEGKDALATSTPAKIPAKKKK